MGATIPKKNTAIPMPIPACAPGFRPEEEPVSGGSVALGVELVVDVMGVTTVVDGVDTVLVELAVIGCSSLQVVVRWRQPPW